MVHGSMQIHAQVATHALTCEHLWSPETSENTAELWLQSWQWQTGIQLPMQSQILKLKPTIINPSDSMYDVIA
jgi:hypothetical protein